MTEDERTDFLSAQSTCRSNGGGHLLQIDDQREGDFVSELLLSMDESVGPVWTGGVLSAAAGKTFALWHGDETPILHSNFIGDTAGTTDGASSLGVALLRTPDYYYWAGLALTANASFVCETPQENVGCLREPGGADYNGTASRGESGRQCLRWDTPGLQEIFSGQASWTHNYCR